MLCSDLFEARMSDVAHTVDDILDLTSMTASVDFDAETVVMRFMLYNIPGRITFRPRPSIKFRSRVYAAAVAMNNGVRPTWKAVPNLVSGPLKPQAIKILTNPAGWRVVHLQYDSIKF
jgi:hypothetical protein